MPRNLFLQNLKMHMKTAEGEESGGGAGSDAGADGGQGDESGSDDDSGSDADDDADSDASDDPGEGSKDGEKDGEDKGVDAETAKLLKDMMKWKTKARESQSEISEAKRELEAFRKTLGDKSLDEVKEMLQAQKESEVKSLEKKGEYDRIVARMREENESTVNQLNERIQELENEIKGRESTVNELTIGRAFADSEFVKESLTLPMSITRKEFGDHFDLVDGKVVGYDKPAGQSERTPLVDSSGDPLPFEKAIAKLVESHPESKRLIRSKVKPGAKSGTEAVPGRKPEGPKRTGISRIESALKSQD